MSSVKDRSVALLLTGGSFGSFSNQQSTSPFFRSPLAMVDLKGTLFGVPAFASAEYLDRKLPSRRCAPDQIIGEVSSVAYNLRRELLCHYSFVVGKTVIFPQSAPLRAPKPWNCSMK